MSIKLMAMVFDIQDLNPKEKLTLIALADHASDEGQSCYPSRGRLMHKTALSASSVQRALAGLKEKKIIRVIGHTNMNVVEWLFDMTILKALVVEYQSDRPYPQVTETIPPSQPDHETVIEPSVEPVPVVIFPNGDLVPDNKICERCQKAPKAPRARKYCVECQLATSGEWETLNQHIAIKVYRKREKEYRLDEPQVRLIIDAVGNTAPSLTRWGIYLDHWIANGWNIKKNGLGNVLAAYKAKTYDERLMTKQVADPIPHENVGVISEENFQPAPNSK